MTIRTRAVVAMSALFAAVVLAAATLAAQAPDRGARGMGPGSGPGPMMMLQRLDLTDAQKEQVRAIMAERTGKDAGRTLGKLRQDLTAAVMADTPDTAKIEQLKSAITEAETAALNERVDLQLRIAQVLTPEQRQKAREAPPAGPRRQGL